jgi:hypothetical protein
MRYMLIHTNLDPVAADEIPDAEQLGAWIEEIVARGIHVQGHRLRPVSDATTVRMRDGEVVLDGPFAETKEEIAGFDIIDCADLDEALEVAAKHPTVRHGTIEVRPFWD